MHAALDQQPRQGRGEVVPNVGRDLDQGVEGAHRRVLEVRLPFGQPPGGRRLDVGHHRHHWDPGEPAQRQDRSGHEGEQVVDDHDPLGVTPGPPRPGHQAYEHADRDGHLLEAEHVDEGDHVCTRDTDLIGGHPDEDLTAAGVGSQGGHQELVQRHPLRFEGAEQADLELVAGDRPSGELVDAVGANQRPHVGDSHCCSLLTSFSIAASTVPQELPTLSGVGAAPETTCSPLRTRRIASTHACGSNGSTWTTSG